MTDALLVEVKSGKIRHVPWEHIYVNNEGYLFIPDKNGEPIWAQLVNWQWMRHDTEVPEA